jgi:hypothetical protein
MHEAAFEFPYSKYRVGMFRFEPHLIDAARVNKFTIGFFKEVKALKPSNHIQF